MAPRSSSRLHCVKELVSGDEGRTTPNVSELLENRAKPLKLDVLNVIMDY
jgi:tRNA U54 and U55 pseudouridine synthase Pus10